jgi:small-conductance mechanosensitive channel
MLQRGYLRARCTFETGRDLRQVRDSIRTGLGYAGIVIAALAAFSYAGFNLNLAIVAGVLGRHRFRPQSVISYQV